MGRNIGDGYRSVPMRFYMVSTECYVQISGLDVSPNRQKVIVISCKAF